VDMESRLDWLSPKVRIFATNYICSAIVCTAALAMAALFYQGDAETQFMKLSSDAIIYEAPTVEFSAPLPHTKEAAAQKQKQPNLHMHSNSPPRGWKWATPEAAFKALPLGKGIHTEKQLAQHIKLDSPKSQNTHVPNESPPKNTTVHAAGSKVQQAQQGVAQHEAPQTTETTEETKCKESFGFLPCSDSLGGAIVLMLFYGGVLMFAAGLIGDGGEAVLDHGIMSPAIIGGVLLPILGAVPDAIIIAMSALASDAKLAERKVSVGVGTLAGSTVMLLTVAVAGGLHKGRCDLGPDGEAIEQTFLGEKFKAGTPNPREWENWCQQLRTTGITHERSVLNVKYFMMLTSMLYISAQSCSWAFGPAAAATKVGCLVNAGCCFGLLAVYLVVNLMTDNGADKQEVVKETRILGALQDFHVQGQSGLAVMDPVTHKCNRSAVKEIFLAFDLDNNGTLDEREVDRFVTVLWAANEMAVPPYVLQELKAAQGEKVRASRSGKDIEAQTSKGRGFVGCFSAARPATTEAGHSILNIDQDVFVESVSKLLEEENRKLQEEGSDEDGPMSVTHALLSILLGTILVALFSDGVVSAIDAFGKQTGIPNFIIGFIVCPFASNASELFSSLQFAGAKKRRNISVTFSQIYAACTMNNCLCLGVLLLMVYIRNLTWDYAAEVACIIFATFAIGLGTCTTTIKYSFALWALLVYPLSLTVVEAMHLGGLK